MGILQEVTCAHCREIVTDPITLDCCHHLCAEHVANFSNRQYVECPICKVTTPVSEGGLKVDSVKKIVVNYLQETTKSEEVEEKDPEFVPQPVTCANCEEEVATLRCVGCRADGAPLCEACSKRIHAQGLFTNHTFVDVNAQVPQKELKEQVRMVCPEHDEKLEFYCCSCRCLICSHCLILGGHRGHDQSSLSDAYQTSKDTLAAWRARINGRLHDSKDLLEHFAALDEAVTRNAERQREAVNGEMDRLRELVETKRRQLLQKSALEEKQKRSELQLQMQRVAQLGEEAQSLVSRAEVLDTFENKHAFVVLILALIEDMKNCTRHDVDDHRRVDANFRCLYTDDQVKTLGDLDLGRGAFAPAPSYGGVQQMESNPSSATVHQHAFHGGSASVHWGYGVAQHVVVAPQAYALAPHAPQVMVYRASVPPQN